MNASKPSSDRMPWYRWALVPLALPAAVVVAVPLGLLALLSIPYYAVFPDHHPHFVDFSGSPRQRQLLASWRGKYRRLGLVGRIGVALSGRRRRHPVHVREIKSA